MTTLVLSAEMANFQQFMDFVEKESGNAGFDGSMTRKILLAFEEAVVNVINYAYDGGDGQVEVTCEEPTRAKGIRIQIVDQGKAFDPLQKEDPNIDIPVEERPIGGLGIFMIRKTMADLGYERIEGKNIFTMSKFLSEADGTGKS